MAEQIKTHIEQIDRESQRAYEQAAAEIGGMAVTPVAGPGEQFSGSRGHQVTVREGHTAVKISGVVNAEEGTGPFYARVQEIQAAEAAAAQAADPESRSQA